MAYIGKSPVIGNFVKLDAISVVNGQAAYTMQNGGSNFTDYESVNQFLVSLNGTIQAPTDSFTVSGSTLTFASNLATGDVIDFIMVFGNSLSAGTPTDATVSTAKIVDDAVTAAKINNDIISGSTELATAPADTDEFLVSDAGTLKRIDYSYIKGSTNLNHFGSLAITSDTAISGAGVLSPSVRQNYNSSVTVSSGKIKVAQTGWYLVLYGISGKCTSGDDVFRPVITITENDGGATEDGNYAYLYLNGNNYDTGFVSYLWDVQDATNQAVYMGYAEASNITLFGDGGGKRDVTYMQLYRLGDT